MNILNRKIIKLAEVILASICLATKCVLLDFLVLLDHLHIFAVYLLGTTYFGYCFIMAIVAASSVKGFNLYGTLNLYYSLVGATLYVTSEIILWIAEHNFDKPNVFGLLVAAMLALLLILDAIGISQ